MWPTAAGIVTIFLLSEGFVEEYLWKSVASSSKENTRNTNKQTNFCSSIIVGTELLANCVGYFMNLTIRTKIYHISEIIGAKVIIFAFD